VAWADASFRQPLGNGSESCCIAGMAHPKLALWIALFSPVLLAPAYAQRGGGHGGGRWWWSRCRRRGRRGSRRRSLGWIRRRWWFSAAVITAAGATMEAVTGDRASILERADGAILTMGIIRAIHITGTIRLTAASILPHMAAALIRRRQRTVNRTDIRIRNRARDNPHIRYSSSTRSSNTRSSNTRNNSTRKQQQYPQQPPTPPQPTAGNNQGQGFYLIAFNDHTHPCRHGVQGRRRSDPLDHARKARRCKPPYRVWTFGSASRSIAIETWISRSRSGFLIWLNPTLTPLRPGPARLSRRRNSFCRLSAGRRRGTELAGPFIVRDPAARRQYSDP